MGIPHGQRSTAGVQKEQKQTQEKETVKHIPLRRMALSCDTFIDIVIDICMRKLRITSTNYGIGCDGTLEKLINSQVRL